MSEWRIDPSDDAKYIGDRLEELDDTLRRIAEALERLIAKHDDDDTDLP